VSVQPEPAARQDYCFSNVEAKVESSGGSMVLGWTIWETPGILVEGEFHSCWQSPSGELVDVTPKRDGERRILFLPDPSRTWERLFVCNVRLPLVDTPEIQAQIKYFEGEEALRQKYWCGDHAEIPIDELLALQTSLEQSVGSASSDRPGRNDRCWCGSGKKYKTCHLRSDDQLLHSLRNS
jgi:hypothetical protein